MSKATIAKCLDSLTDSLAAIEHERWSHWQKHVHDNGTHQKDGSLILPAELVERWKRQIETPFTELTEAEKESDREQVRKYLPLIKNALTD